MVSVRSAVLGTKLPGSGTVELRQELNFKAPVRIGDPNRLGSSGAKLINNFPGYGLYQSDGSSWSLLAGNSGVTDMLGVDLP